MKTLLLTITLSLFMTVANAQNVWVSAPPQVRPPITYTVPLAPVPSYYITPQPVVRYSWTPYYYNVPVTTWRYGCFGLRRWPITTYHPHVQWNYRAYPNYTYYGYPY